MLHKFSPYLYGFVLIMIASQLSAQGGLNSPFSRYGIGDRADPGFYHLRSMGGISAAYSDTYHMNFENPASLSMLRATSFDVGVSMKSSWLSDENTSSQIWSGNLEYLALAFPLRNPLNEVFDRSKKKYWLGMGFALRPYTTVGYDITNTEETADVGIVENNFVGSGGSYEVLWGNSFRYQNFSIGLNLGYILGNIKYERNTGFPNTTNSFDNRFHYDYSLRAFTWRLGTLYQFFLNKDAVTKKLGTQPNVLNVGAYVSSKTSLKTNAEEILFGEYNILGTGTGISAITDTLSARTGIEGRGNLPAEFGFGAMYFKGSDWRLAIDYKRTLWSQYRNEANPEELSDTQRLSIGGSFRPNYKSFTYRDRILYRFGAYLSEDPRSIEQESISSYGVTFGLGLPFIYQRKVSNMNLAFDFGRRGNTSTVRETYVKLGLGLTFNDDEWFYKRKYN